ncbi:tyrosyl-trna synthetase [Phlyctema vagabunda]|uniref:tyrosine--tRNA ligase n=1 Tax=Phlyctema vagabunda TaxID=108571 RepID=A0ABR4PPD5_9HELO
MESSLSAEERLELITRRLPEAPGRDEIKAILERGQNPKGIWVTVPTGRPHLGYYVPLLKMVDFFRAGVDFNVCLGDIYGFLINFKYPFEQVQQRKKFYKHVLGAVFESIGVSSPSLPFIEETSYAFTQEHILDIYKLCALSSQQELRKTGDEVGASTMFGPMLTPILQALDEEYQKSDFDFGGLDQRGLFEYAEKFLPKMGFRKRAHLMNDMLPGLNGGKMSASLPESKIDCLDDPETVKRKIFAVECKEGDASSNGLLALLRLVIIPISELRAETAQSQAEQRTERRQENPSYPFCDIDAPLGTVLTIETQDHTLLHVSTYKALESAYTERRISHFALKAVVTNAINQLLSHVRAVYDGSKDWQDVERLAYPDTEDEFISTHSAGAKVAPALKSSIDTNFCFPVNETWNEEVKLTPFIPALHATQFFEGSISQQTALWAEYQIGPFNSTADFVHTFIEGTILCREEATLFAFLDRATDDLGGLVALTNTSLFNLSTEIGYLMALPSHRDKAYLLSSVIHLVLQYVFDLGMRRVEWRVSEANVDLQKQVENLGFVKEGVLRWARAGRYAGKKSGLVGEQEISNGSEYHTVLYSFCWEDWEKEFPRRLEIK